MEYELGWKGTIKFDYASCSEAMQEKLEQMLNAALIQRGDRIRITLEISPSMTCCACGHSKEQHINDCGCEFRIGEYHCKCNAFEKL